MSQGQIGMTICLTMSDLEKIRGAEGDAENGPGEDGCPLEKSLKDLNRVEVFAILLFGLTDGSFYQSIQFSNKASSASCLVQTSPMLSPWPLV